ncbi:MAG: alpha-L-fucosidase [Pseudopedobacter saltans]|uniref:alpha-L-fucosidase n=1 Tax=Pseudopedobacter saltans TaxID=151895 RepID=A0A2W5EYR9_9SPHI|nr:MAG: alpha-L-fucosidase [Pseudopedobacter saltans]
MKGKGILFGGLYTLLLANHVVAQTAKDNKVIIEASDSYQTIIQKAANVVPSERQLKWQQLELNAFFHFGINTFTDKEWGDGKESPQLFNPTKLNAKQWVESVKNAGFKQVILTAKHHDGFCLWPSKYTEHSVKNSPWKNGKGDVVKEVADACHQLGVGFGIYLSPWDRNSQLYGTGAPYNEYFVNQLTELLTNYGQVDEVWFDGANGEGPNGKKQIYDFDSWFKVIRKLQPQAVIFGMGPDVRWVGTETGYGRETEWSVVPINNLDPKLVQDNSQHDAAFKPQGDMTSNDLGSREKILKAKGLVWYPAETDVSIRPGWFYHLSEDEKVKSPGKLMDIYIHSVGRNGVLLLNVPPNKEGLVSEADVKSLKGFKSLMDATFKKNLAAGATVFSSQGINPSGLIDGNFDSYFTVDDKDTSAVALITLPKKKTFNLLSLQEFITDGQAVESWTLEYNTGTEWKELARGTTIGYKRLVTFPEVTADELRLKILQSRVAPKLSEFGLYQLPTDWENK